MGHPADGMHRRVDAIFDDEADARAAALESMTGSLTDTFGEPRLVIDSKDGVCRPTWGFVVPFEELKAFFRAKDERMASQAEAANMARRGTGPTETP